MAGTDHDDVEFVIGRAHAQFSRPSFIRRSDEMGEHRRGYARLESRAQNAILLAAID
jgi:hypothetical protein